jgi:hypothetical protein
LTKAITHLSLEWLKIVPNGLLLRFVLFLDNLSSTELRVKAMLMMMMIIMPSTHLLMWVRESCCWIKKILKQNWISMRGLDVLFLVFFQTGGV